MAEVKNLKGLLKAENLMCVQIDKRMIGEAGDYYYNIAFTTGKDIMLLTAGKVADNLELFKKYNLGLDFIDKKLRIVDFMLVG